MLNGNVTHVVRGGGHWLSKGLAGIVVSTKLLLETKQLSSCLTSNKVFVNSCVGHILFLIIQLTVKQKLIYNFFISPKNAHYMFLHLFLPNLSYMFPCVIHHPQGELSVLAQNCQQFTRLLHELCYRV
jgi:hypothetical protein